MKPGGGLFLPAMSPSVRMSAGPGGVPHVQLHPAACGRLALWTGAVTTASGFGTNVHPPGRGHFCKGGLQV